MKSAASPLLNKFNQLRKSNHCRKLNPNPTSFANGRYQVKRFLGEGGKKKVYLAHNTTLDRDVAFALIKTEKLDEASRNRIKREAQAMLRNAHYFLH